MMQKGELSPLIHLNALSKWYPNAWKMVDTIRARRDRNLPAWPDWCFIPLIGWRIIEKNCQGSGLPTVKPGMCELAAIGTWRYTQGIYRFDRDLLTSLVATELTGDLPCDVLLRLPEWSVYIETPNLSLGPLPLQGIWAHLDWDMVDGTTIVRFLMDIEQLIIPLYLNIGPWSLQEAVRRMMDNARRVAERERIKPPVEFSAMASEMIKHLQPFLSLLLYLCSDEPEMTCPLGTTPWRPEMKKTKKGMRLFAPDKPTIWRVGETIGRVLRQGKAEVSSVGNPPRAHIRRAHWHGYWTGSGEQKRFKYNWLSPIVVRGREIIEQDPAQTKGRQIRPETEM
jgi:hypothetical protein